MHEAIV